MVASDGFADYLREQLAPLGRIALRRMFGKTGVFCQGLMFAIVADDALYVRVDAQSRAAFQEAAPPLTYARRGRRIDLPFWRVPDRLMDEPEALVGWARIALAAAGRVAAERHRVAPPRTVRSRKG